MHSVRTPPGKELGPLLLPVLAVNPQESPQLLVHPFHLPVRLRPVPRREADCNPSFSMKAFHTRDVNWWPLSETMSSRRP
jgi:hypothetical protein